MEVELTDVCLRVQPDYIKTSITLLFDEYAKLHQWFWVLVRAGNVYSTDGLTCGHAAKQNISAERQFEKEMIAFRVRDRRWHSGFRLEMNESSRVAQAATG